MPSPLPPPWQVTGAAETTSRWLRRRRLGGSRAKLLLQLWHGRRRSLLAAAPGNPGVQQLCPWVGRPLALAAPRCDQRRPLIDLIDLLCVCSSGLRATFGVLLRACVPAVPGRVHGLRPGGTHGGCMGSGRRVVPACAAERHEDVSMPAAVDHWSTAAGSDLYSARAVSMPKGHRNCPEGGRGRQLAPGPSR